MDLIAALGAAPPHPPVKDKETPDRAPSGERDQSRNEFDEALDAAAPSSPPSPSEGRTAAAAKLGQTHVSHRRFGAEAAQAVIDSETVTEPSLANPLLAIAEQPIDGADAPQPDHDLSLPPQIAETSPENELSAAIALAVLARGVANTEAKAGDAASAGETLEPAAIARSGDALLTSEKSPLADRIRTAIESEDKTVRPDEMPKPEKSKATGDVLPEATTARVALSYAETSAAKSAPPAPADQLAPATLNGALLAALKDLTPADLTAETLPAGLLEGLSKAKTTLSAPEAARLLDKLRLAPQPAAPAEISPAAFTDSAPQTHSAPKLEILQQQPHVGALDAARQVIAAIRTDVKGDAIEVRLDPPELGRVRIHFTMDRPDSVTAIVTADRSDTLDTMRRHASDLARELSRAGFANVELEFKSGGERSHSGDAPKPQFGARIADEKAAEPANFIYARSRLDGRLDRLV